MKHLYESLAACAKEEEIKAEFCKFFKMKIFALRGLDLAFNIGAGSSPLLPDSDGDGMDDGEEMALGTSPVTADTDRDGLSDGQENSIGTNPLQPDSDSDGMNDGWEYQHRNAGFSPTVDNSTDANPNNNIGADPDGECETKTAMLKAGWKYEVRLCHAGTNGSGSGYPDYDYELDCGSGTLPNNVLVDDPDSLFGTDYTSSTFAGDGKVATITVYAVIGVRVCNPDDSTWAELEEGRVVLDDEQLRIKIEVAPQLKSLAQCRQVFGSALIVKTSGTCPAGVFVPIPDDAVLVNLSGKSEIRISKTRQQLISLGLMPSKNDDGVNEMAWVDVPEKTGQDLSDSTVFSALGYAFRGKAIVASNPNFEASPPISQRSKVLILQKKMV